MRSDNVILFLFHGTLQFDFIVELTLPVHYSKNIYLIKKMKKNAAKDTGDRL